MVRVLTPAARTEGSGGQPVVSALGCSRTSTAEKRSRLRTTSSPSFLRSSTRSIQTLLSRVWANHEPDFSWPTRTTTPSTVETIVPLVRGNCWVIRTLAPGLRFSIAGDGRGAGAGGQMAEGQMAEGREAEGRRTLTPALSLGGRGRKREGAGKRD